MHHLVHKRSSKPITSCAFSQNDDNIVYVGHDALVWRFDYKGTEETKEFD